MLFYIHMHLPALLTLHNLGDCAVLSQQTVLPIHSCRKEALPFKFSERVRLSSPMHLAY